MKNRILLQRHSSGCPRRIRRRETAGKELRNELLAVRQGVKRRERRSLQTGSTSCGVSLSQTNGLRLFDAVFHRNLLFIIPQAPGWYRAVFAPSSVNVVNSTTGSTANHRQPIQRQNLGGTGFFLSFSLSLSLLVSLLSRCRCPSPLFFSLVLYFGSSRVPAEIKQLLPTLPLRRRRSYCLLKITPFAGYLLPIWRTLTCSLGMSYGLVLWASHRDNRIARKRMKILKRTAIFCQTFLFF